MADEGRTIGVATAKINSDLSGLRRDRTIGVRMFREIGDAGRQMGTAIQSGSTVANNALSRLAQGFRQAKAEADAFNRSDLGTIRAGLQDSARSFGVLSAAAGAFVGFGTAAAQRVLRLQGLFKVLSGSQELANQRMAKLRDFADRTGQSFLDVAEGAQAILPAVGRANVDLEQTLSLVQRLALLDPAQGIQGAAFAVRELLGGDTKSLAGRFELPRKQLAQLLKDARGAPQEIINGLDRMVQGLGFTAEAMEEMGASGVNAFARAKGALTEAMATAFTPLLKNVILPLVNRFADFVTQLNATNPALLQTVSIFAVAAAGIAPLLLVLSQVITAYEKLSKVSQLQGLGKLGVGAAALAAGAAAGSFLTQRIASQADDPGLQQRLKSVGSGTEDLKRIQQGESVLGVVLPRLAQVFTIFITLLLEFVKRITQVFASAANLIGQALDLIVSVFKLGAGVLQEGFGSVQKVLGDILISLGAAAEKLGIDPGVIGDLGIGALQGGLQNITGGQQLQQQALTRLGQGIDASQVAQAAEDVDRVFTDLQRGIVNGVNDLLNAGGEGGNQAQQAIDFLVGGINSGVAKLNEVAGNVKNALFFKPEFSEEQIAAFGEFQQKLQEAVDKFNEQRKEAIDDFNERADETRVDRRVRDTRDTADEALRAARAFKGLQDALSGIDTQKIANLARIQAEAEAERDRIVSESNERQIERQRKHAKDLEELERQHRDTLIEAASKLDAVAVFNAQKAFEDRQTQINDQFNEENAAEAQAQSQALDQLRINLEARLQAERDAADAARQQRIDEFNEAQALEAENRQFRLQRQAEDDKLQDDRAKANLDKRLAQIDDQEKKERAMLEKSFIETFNKLASDANQHQRNMIQIQGAGTQNLEAGLLAFWTRANQMAAAQINALGTGAKPPATTTQSRPPVIRRPSGGGPSRIITFATGGTLPYTGFFHGHEGEEVLNPQVSGALRRMMGGTINQNQLVNNIANGGSGGINVGKVEVLIQGDMGQRSNSEIEALIAAGTRRAFADILKETMAGGRPA